MFDFIRKLFVRADAVQSKDEAPDVVEDWLKQHQFDEKAVHEAVYALSKEELEEGLALFSQASKFSYFGVTVDDYIRAFKSMIFGLGLEHNAAVRKKIDWDKLELEQHLVLKPDDVRPEHSWTEVLQDGQSVTRNQPEMWVFTLLLAYEDCRYFLALLILTKKNGVWCFSDNKEQDVPLVVTSELLPLPVHAKEQVRDFVNQVANAPMPKELIKVMVHNYLVQNNLR